MVNLPLTCPVNAWLDSGLRAYLKLLQLIGNSAFDFSTLELSTMQMSQQPKMGPLSGLQAMANWAKFKLNFYLRSTEKMKEVIDLSAAQCFLVEFQAKGVQPPIIFPYSVSRMVMVSPILSHLLWNSATECPFSLALQRRDTDLRAGLWKRDLIQSQSLQILLLKPVISNATDMFVEKDILFFLPSMRQRSLMRSSESSRDLRVLRHQSTEKLVSKTASSFRKRVERIWFMQTPEMLLQFWSLMRLMKFMVSGLKPKRLSHLLKLRCSSLTFLMRVEKRFSISS